MLIDLHTHSLLSDGELLPSEVARRAEAKGYRVIAITDHVDGSNLYHVIPPIQRVSRELTAKGGIVVLPGAEITHVHPEDIASIVEEARRLGAVVVIGHGESPVEPVLPGTNRAMLVAGVDILAHPGLITKDDALLAAEKGIPLEITSRKGHSLTNGHVAAMARETGATLVLNNDAHSPADLIDERMKRTVGLGAGMTPGEYDQIEQTTLQLIARVKERLEKEE